MPEEKGILYVVATPIGNLEDITIRAVNILRSVDVIYSEDTRETVKLLNRYSIETRLETYLGGYRTKVGEVIAELEKGMKVALVSDRGTPAVNDPGFEIVFEARKRGIKIVAVPGPNAAITALSVSGFYADRFYYAGFLPKKGGERDLELKRILKEEAAVVFYESPERLLKTLKDLVEAGGGERSCFVARELTKVNEDYYSGTVSEVAKLVEERKPKGEIVVVLGPIKNEKPTIDAAFELAMELVSSGLKPSEAAKISSKIAGVSRNQLYRKILKQL
jgi:16S rRNA (cytidine1402-2'-O)-methyltransferase